VLPVAVHVHPYLDDPHELHQVCGRLSNAVAAKDDVPGRGSAEALVGRDHAVTILVDTTAAAGRDVSRKRTNCRMSLGDATSVAPANSAVHVMF